MSLLLLLVLFQYKSLSSSINCSTSCICHPEHKFASCTNSRLNNLNISIPPYTEHLNLSFNQLVFIQSQAFQGVRLLHTLLLNDNCITSLADGAFSTLEFLLKLDLSCNQISVLSGGFSVGLISLRELYIRDNQLTILNNDSFSHLDAIQKIDLRNNCIQTIEVKAFSSLSTLRRMYLDKNQITSLEKRVFSMLRNLEELWLSENAIRHLEVGVLSPLTSLSLLDLTYNNLTQVDFKAFLSLQSRSTHIRLQGNNWTCDCDLHRVFQKLDSVQRLLLDDYDKLNCVDDDNTPHYIRDTRLCFGETVTVLIITITVLITVVAAIIMAEKKKGKNTKKGKQWAEVNELSCDSQN